MTSVLQQLPARDHVLMDVYRIRPNWNYTALLQASQKFEFAAWYRDLEVEKCNVVFHIPPLK